VSPCASIRFVIVVIYKVMDAFYISQQSVDFTLPKYVDFTLLKDVDAKLLVTTYSQANRNNIQQAFLPKTEMLHFI
jgi:hypothetical protein